MHTTEFITKLRKLGTYQSGWNCSGPVTPSDASIHDAEQFARNHDFDSIHLPGISAADDGEINFWWDVEGLYIDLGFFGDGSYSFYARLPNGKEIAVDHAPLSQPLPGELVQGLSVTRSPSTIEEFA